MSRGRSIPRAIAIENRARRILATLTAAERLVAALRFHEGLSIADVGRVCRAAGVPCNVRRIVDRLVAKAVPLSA